MAQNLLWTLEVQLVAAEWSPHLRFQQIFSTFARSLLLTVFSYYDPRWLVFFSILPLFVPEENCLVKWHRIFTCWIPLPLPEQQFRSGTQKHCVQLGKNTHWPHLFFTQCHTLEEALHSLLFTSFLMQDPGLSKSLRKCNLASPQGLWHYDYYCVVFLSLSLGSARRLGLQHCD